MTVTKDISMLCLFKSKIDEAVSFVPRMHEADKVKAIHFWNSISDKLQGIINNSCGNIDSESIKTAENEFEKGHLDINHSNASNDTPNIPSDFINLSSNYVINNEILEQYHPTDPSQAQLLASDALSIVTESSLNNISSISHFSSTNGSISSCEGNITDTYIADDTLSESNSDDTVLNSCLSDTRTIESVLDDSVKDSDFMSKEASHDERNLNKTSGFMEQNTGQLHLCKSANNRQLLSDNADVRKDKTSDRENDNKFSVLKLSDLNDKDGGKFQICDDQEVDDSEESESSDDSDDFDPDGAVSNDESDSSDDSDPDAAVSNDESCSSDKFDLDAAVSNAESDSSQTGYTTTPIVSFVVSHSQEVSAKNALTTESSQKRSKNKRKSVPSRPHACTECPAKFATKGNLNVHMRKHTGEKPYPCSKCSSSFTTKGNLKRHLKTHTGEKPFQCTHCGNRFTEKKSLNVHMRRHTGERPYQCQECGKRFAQSGILKTHMSMHLDEKFHLCEHCGKSFRQRSQLQIHKLRHENVRKHACSICSSRFLTKGDLERHIRSHTGERPFVCEICSKGFTRQQSLNEHMNRHYGLKPYVCKYCSRTFTEMSACYKHVKQHEKRNADGVKNSQTESSESSKLSEESSHNIACSNSFEKQLVKDDLSNDDELSPRDVDTNQSMMNRYIEDFMV